MRNRIITIIAAMVMAVGMLVFSPVAANASSDSVCATYNYGKIKTCMTATWIRDGNNIILTSFGHTTPVGCSRLQTNKYPDRYAEFPGVNFSPGPSNACTGTVGVYRRAPSTGGARFLYAAMANINNDFDHGLHWVVTLTLAGDMTMVDYWCSPCNVGTGE